MNTWNGCIKWVLTDEDIKKIQNWVLICSPKSIRVPDMLNLDFFVALIDRFGYTAEFIFDNNVLRIRNENHIYYLDNQANPTSGSIYKYIGTFRNERISSEEKPKGATFLPTTNFKESFLKDIIHINDNWIPNFETYIANGKLKFYVDEDAINPEAQEFLITRLRKVPDYEQYIIAWKNSMEK